MRNLRYLIKYILYFIILLSSILQTRAQYTFKDIAEVYNTYIESYKSLRQSYIYKYNLDQMPNFQMMSDDSTTTFIVPRALPALSSYTDSVFYRNSLKIHPFNLQNDTNRINDYYADEIYTGYALGFLFNILNPFDDYSPQFNSSPQLMIPILLDSNYVLNCCQKLDKTLIKLLTEVCDELNQEFSVYFGRQLYPKFRVAYNRRRPFILESDSGVIDISSQLVYSIYLKTLSLYQPFLNAYNNTRGVQDITYYKGYFFIPGEHLFHLPLHINIDSSGNYHNLVNKEYQIPEEIVVYDFVEDFKNQISFLLAHELAHLYTDVRSSPYFPEREIYCDCIAYTVIWQNVTKPDRNFRNMGALPDFILQSSRQRADYLFWNYKYENEDRLKRLHFIHSLINIDNVDYSNMESLYYSFPSIPKCTNILDN